MAFTPVDKLTSHAALELIVTDAKEYYFRMDRAVELLTQAFTSLNGMPASWSAAISFIDAQEAASPGDKAWQALKLRKDSLVADFTAMRDKVQQVRDAAIAAQNA